MFTVKLHDDVTTRIALKKKKRGCLSTLIRASLLTRRSSPLSGVLHMGLYKCVGVEEVYGSNKSIGSG